MRAASAVALVAVLAFASCSSTREVELGLPVRPKLPLVGTEKIYVGPFLRESRGDEAGPRMKLDVATEFERYLRRLLRKESKLVILREVEQLRPPTTDSLQLAAASEFWRQLGSETGADYIVAGAIDFQVQDRTGYKTEEYVSPVDGRTYYRQVLVEQTGFSYDILLQVYDGRSGKLVLEEPLKDFQERPERSFDEFVGMFGNLYALENQLVGFFVPRTVRSKRVLLAP
jgi:hypothetical protein